MPKERVEHLAEGIVLHLGDCRDVLPSLGRVDAIVTDPPYGIDIVKNGRIGGTSKDVARWNGQINSEYHGPIIGDDKPIEPSFLLDFKVPSIIWGGNYIADKLPPTKGWLIWYKRINNQSNNFADCEIAWSNLNCPARVYQQLWMGMLRDSEAQEHYHPTQKSIGVMEWCIKKLPEECEIILDPFMGSGTTGMACGKLGRKFIGVELEERYFEIAIRRIEKALKQPDLFIATPRPVQHKLL